MRRATIVVTLTLVGVIFSGCAREPETVMSPDDVVSERLAALEAVEREQFDAFVTQSRDQLAEFGIPLPEFGGLAAIDDIDALVTECIVALNPRLKVARSDAGFTVTYFGTVGDTYDRISWTIESCNAQYGVADLHAAPTTGSIEVAWRYQDATQRIVPCLRGVGVSVPSPPSVLEFAGHAGTSREYNPYAFAIADPVSLARAMALCPPSDAVLDAHIDAHNAAQVDRPVDAPIVAPSDAPGGAPAPSEGR